MRFLIMGAALSLAVGAAQSADLVVESPAPAAPSAASSGLYLSVHGGWWAPESAEAIFIYGGSADVQFDSGSGLRLGGAIGLDVTPNLSVEGEVSYGSTSLETVHIFGDDYDIEGDVTTLALMSNVIVGADLGGWRPYVGVGVGAVHMSLEVPVQPAPGSGLNDSGWTWGAQFLAGIEFDVAEDLTVGARYRYQYRGEVEVRDGDDDPVTLFGSASQSLELTAKLSF